MNDVERLGALVVESDPLLLMFASDAAEDAGLVPYEARTPERALRLLGERGDLVAMFVDTDLVGRMDGLELAWTVHRRRPDIRIVVMSAGGTPDRKSLPPGAVYIPKPYDVRRIMKAMREALAFPSQGPDAVMVN